MEVPSTELYWHMGETAIRLRSLMDLIWNSSNKFGMGQLKPVRRTGSSEPSFFCKVLKKASGQEKPRRLAAHLSANTRLEKNPGCCSWLTVPCASLGAPWISVPAAATSVSPCKVSHAEKYRVRSPPPHRALGAAGSRSVIL